jgi:predicted dehydrogenase
VHLVYIATPPFLHYEQARGALREGKHVIVEKPLAVTMEQADEIVSLARDTRRLLRPSGFSPRVTRPIRPINASP